MKDDGTSVVGAGKVLQVVSNATATDSSIATSWANYLAVTITGVVSTSTVIVTAYVHGEQDAVASNHVEYRLYRGGSNISVESVYLEENNTAARNNVSLIDHDNPGSGSSTYSLQDYKTGAGVTGTSYNATIIVMEIGA